jgi:hypothetical protein
VGELAEPLCSNHDKIVAHLITTLAVTKFFLGHKLVSKTIGALNSCLLKAKKISEESKAQIN